MVSDADARDVRGALGVLVWENLWSDLDDGTDERLAGPAGGGCLDRSGGDPLRRHRVRSGRRRGLLSASGRRYPPAEQYDWESHGKEELAAVRLHIREAMSSVVPAALKNPEFCWFDALTSSVDPEHHF
ncbi:hypothetical protein GCM10022403_064630 [Streptomyces coacervatus]|uniref:Uncharacterized protein n=1 Tax=Streptomyces coacervatus TaxID=647381 RepID=A0ABP7IMD4_9ACTN